MTSDSAWTPIALTVFLAFMAALMISAAASISQAAPVIERAPIGSHVPLLTLEKNENPQNVLIIYTKLDSTCRIEIKDEEPTLSEYWLMDRARYKRVNPLIVRGIEKRIKVVDEVPADQHSFQVRLSDFTELEHDLGSDPLITVRSEGQPGHCEAVAILHMGASDQYRSIQIDRVYAKSEKKLLPPFRRLVELTISGADLATGEKFSRSFQQKH